MKKIIILFLAALCITPVFSSKLSKFLNQMEEKDKAAQQREWQQDMNFADLSFRLERRYTDDRGQHCRSYIFRAKSNPYRHGNYVVCDER